MDFHFFLGISTKSDNPPPVWGHVTRVLRGHVSAPAHFAGAATRVTGGEQREQAETGHQDRQQRETEPALAELAVSVITGTNVIICEVFILVMTVVEKTLGAPGQDTHSIPCLIRSGE